MKAKFEYFIMFSNLSDLKGWAKISNIHSGLSLLLKYSYTKDYITKIQWPDKLCTFFSLPLPCTEIEGTFSGLRICS